MGVVNTKEVDGFLVIVCQVQSIVCIPCHELVSSGFQHVSRVFLFHQLWYLCVWWSILYRLCLFSWDQQCSGCYGGRNRWETKCKDEGIRDIFYSTSKIFWPHLANMHQDVNYIRNMQVVSSNRVHSTHSCEANKCWIIKLFLSSVPASILCGFVSLFVRVCRVSQFLVQEMTTFNEWHH